MQRLGVILLTDTLAGEGGVTPPLACVGTFGILLRQGQSLNRFGPRLFEGQMRIDDASTRNF